MSSGSSFIDEINEEIRRDKVLRTLKEHKDGISWLILIIVAIIVGHSYWYSNKRKRLEIATTSLYNDIYSPDPKTEQEEKRRKANLDNMIENAPSDLVPFLSLIRAGRELRDPNNTLTASKKLLEIAEDKNIDVVWRDVAMLIYVSYRLESKEKLAKRLTPLTEEGRPFRYSALESLAMVYAVEQDKAKAVEILSRIVDAKDAPDTMKKRVKKVMLYLKNHVNETQEPELSDFKKKDPIDSKQDKKNNKGKDKSNSKNNKKANKKRLPKKN